MSRLIPIIANAVGSFLIEVLLNDGSRGLEAIHHAGGLTMVLDPGHKPAGLQQNAMTSMVQSRLLEMKL